MWWGACGRARLYGGLLVGAYDEVILSQRFPGKSAMVQTEHPACLLREVGVAVKDPTAMLPGADDKALAQREDVEDLTAQRYAAYLLQPVLRTPGTTRSRHMKPAPERYAF